ncbi:FUSC family protein [Myxococcus sp. CA056]|uniref:FUSC family protein n=1 Tax=Myxococcus sp. CA056 TaxID=2741740 RepID=UPI00157AE9A2|nr:FUSC family protein [Myxococcus sp. CA056]NTX16005.1 FUSC family protein [Myxococcus sp. CA056]
MHRLLRHIRRFFRLQPGRPAWAAGIRAALAVTIPFSLATLLGFKDAGWTGLTGLLVTLANPGGAYRGRARVMGAVTLLGALVGTIAALAGGRLLLDATLLLVGVFVLTFARCYGDTAGSVGEKLAVIFVASLGAHAVELDAALTRGGALLLGGGWAMLQSLVLWPVHPYRPSRRSIAHVYTSLADGARDLATLSREGAPAEVWTAATTRHLPLRAKIERARETLASTRVGRSEESRRGEHLLVLLELSEQLLGVLFALAQAMEVASPERRLRPVREQVARACDWYAEISQRVATVSLAPETAAVYWPRFPTHHEELGLRGKWLRVVPASVTELLTRLKGHAVAAQRTAMAMRRGDPVEVGNAESMLRANRRRPLLETLRANLNSRSVVLRHALRAGTVACLALVLTRVLGLGEAYWVVLSAIGILQPYSANTEERALQRVTGTLLGGTLAAVIATGVGSPLVLIVVIGVLTAVSVSLLPLNFGAFQILLTPDFLLLATLSAGDWSVAENRALGVLLACVLALAGVWLLWPYPESRRFPDAAATVLRADGNYFRQVAASRSGTEPGVSAARRDLGLAMIDAEASFERLMAEYRGPAHRLEPAMALLTYSRRLAASVTALGEQKAVIPSSEVLDVVAHKASGTLDALADSLKQGQTPPPMPELPLRRIVNDPVSGPLVERVPRQLEILHGAVEKLAWT